MTKVEKSLYFKLGVRKHKRLENLHLQHFDGLLTDRQHILKTNKVIEKYNRLKHLANVRSFEKDLIERNK